MADELFELSLLGGAIERRYRKQRPEIDAIDWRSLERAKFTPAQREAGRRFWTVNAYTEHAAAAGCSAVLRALIEARAPLDLVAAESSFVLDEVAHTELSARIANALGGGAAIRYDAAALVSDPPADLSPLGRAVDLAIGVHCISETFSLPLAREMVRHQPHAVMRTALRRIVKDEAARARTALPSTTAATRSAGCRRRCTRSWRRRCGKKRSARRCASAATSTRSGYSPSAFRTSRLARRPSNS